METSARAVEVAVVVSDLARSEKFYREVFGFERVGEFDTAALSAIALSRDARVLKLIRYHEVPVDKNPEGRALGLRFVSLEVDDVKIAAERARELGATVIGEPKKFEPLRPSARLDDDPCWFVFVLDPDGTRLEIRSGSPWENR